MKEKASTSLPAVAEQEQPSFKGYTLEEIRYHRAMMALRKEFCKSKLMQTVGELTPKRKEKSSKKSGFSIAASIASKVFSNLNTLDYIMMGISLFGTAKKGFNLIRKKK